MSSTRKSQSDRSAETSGKILRAAQKLFALRGFNGVTMRAVASEAGVNLASIVYYFENKEGLYLAVYRQYAEPLMDHQAVFPRFGKEPCQTDGHHLPSG